VMFEDDQGKPWVLSHKLWDALTGEDHENSKT
jgi:hypothetical protein